MGAFECVPLMEIRCESEGPRQTTECLTQEWNTEYRHVKYQILKKEKKVGESLLFFSLLA